MKKKIFSSVMIVIVVSLIVAAFYIFKYIVPTRLTEGEFTSNVSNYGQVIKTTDAQGIVEPENEVLLRSVSDGVIKRIINPPGSQVRSGEIILIMDTEPIEAQIESSEDQLEVMRNNLRKNRLNSKSIRIDLDYSIELKKLKIASTKSELADQKQLLEVGGISPAKIEKTEQELVLAQKEMGNTLQKNSIRLKQLDADEEGLLLQIEIKEKDLESKKNILNEMILRSPSSGLVLNVFGKEGEKFKKGDLLVQVSNMNSFKITGTVDEKYADLVKTGGVVYTKLDNGNLPGKIGRVKPIIENNKVNFDVFLKESNHPKLIPNMKVDLLIVSDSRDSVLRVHKGEAFGGSGLVNIFVVEDHKVIRKEVEIGLVGSEFVEIRKGIKAGESIITSDVSSFRHMKEIEIVNH